LVVARYVAIDKDLILSVEKQRALPPFLPVRAIYVEVDTEEGDIE